MQRRRPPTLATLSLGLAVFAILPLVLQGATIVVPNSLAATEGDLHNALPFAFSARVQQVFDASEFASLSGPELITQIAFRPDTANGVAFSTTITDIQINLSTTSAAPDGLSTTFADNVGADDIVVFPAGPLALSSAYTGPGAGPKDFDIVINLQTPFLYDPALGNLLLDVRNFSGELTTFFDAHFVAADPISRVNTLTVADPTGIADTLGLVARFTTFPVDLLVSDAMTEIVHRYDGATGADLGVFVPTLFPQNIEGLAYGPDGNLYVAAVDFGITPRHVINRYNGSTGAFIDRFAQGVCDGFNFPRAITFHPTTGNVFVTCLENPRIEEFDGVTGAPLGQFNGVGVVLGDPSDLCFSPVDGHLLVSDKDNHRILRYNGTTGAFIDFFVFTTTGGLVLPTSMAFDSANDLYVTGDVVGGIYGVARFDGGSGANKPSVGFPGTATFGVFAAASALPFDMVFLNDGNLAVSIPAANGDVKLLNGTTGAEMAPFVTSAVFPQQPFYMVVQSAPTPTPPTPTPTIETIIDAAEDLPAGSFKSPGHENAVLSILADIQALIAAGDAASIQEAMQKLKNLRKRVDGCEGGGGVADNNDWITDCADQDAIRALIDELIASL